MTPRQLYKLAFLRDCASRGLDLDQMRATVEEAIAQEEAAIGALIKRANIFSNVAGEIVEMAGRLGTAALPIATAGLIATPIVAGGVTGHLAAKVQDDDSDVEQAKADELISEYRRLSEQARRTAAKRQLRPIGPGTMASRGF